MYMGKIPEDTGDIQFRMNVIEIIELFKSFKGKEVLQNINLNIKEGEIFALLGKNASGKSTLISILSGLLKKDRGKILFWEKEPIYPDIFRRVSVFRETPSFYPHLTLKENLIFFSDIYEISDYKALPFKKLELSEHLNKKVNRLSKGTVQKAGLLLSLYKEADVYVLDEPMTHLDPDSRNFIKEKIREINKKGKTFFLTTHLKENIELCDSVSILEEGCIKFTGFSKSKEVENFFYEKNA